MKYSEHIKTKQVAVDKLIKQLKGYNISFSPIDLDNSDLNNVTFTFKDNTYKIAHYCFYKISGPAISDEIWFNNYMLSTIISHFNLAIIKGNQQ